MTRRIWELDAFRGLCILGMVLVHLVYDMVELYGLVDWTYPAAFIRVRDWGGTLFLLLSGICATLGSHSFRRGLWVFGFGTLCTAVTGWMYLLGLADRSLIIWFGVLHCIGSCMMLWPLFRDLSTPVLAGLGLLLVLLGHAASQITVSFSFLFPLGLTAPGFQSADYFPLLPNLGFFLLGSVMGRLLYKDRQSLLPNVNTQAPLIRFLSFCGRHSLVIYLLHQPVLTGILSAVAALS